MLNTNVVTKEYLFDTDVTNNNYNENVKTLNQEIQNKFTKIKEVILNPINDNSGFDPNRPNPYCLPKELFSEWTNIETKIKACDKLVQEKGLTKAEQEKRYQEAFAVAENYLRYELELANLLNQLPTLSGNRTDLETENQAQYTKGNYIKNILGLSRTTAWRIEKLTTENVEKAIEYAKQYHELPTRRLVSLVQKVENIKQVHDILIQEKEHKKILQKAKRKVVAARKIQDALQTYNIIEKSESASPVPQTMYNVIYADTTSLNMTKEDLCSYPVPASDNSVLFLWASSSQLKDMLDVMTFWGFKYSESAIWDRMDNSHPGKYFKNQHDILLVGIKGEGLNVKTRENSIYRNELQEDEQKPEYYPEIIKTMFPGEACLNLFACYTFSSANSTENM